MTGLQSRTACCTVLDEEEGEIEQGVPMDNEQEWDDEQECVGCGEPLDDCACEDEQE